MSGSLFDKPPTASAAEEPPVLDAPPPSCPAMPEPGESPVGCTGDGITREGEIEIQTAGGVLRAELADMWRTYEGRLGPEACTIIMRKFWGYGHVAIFEAVRHEKGEYLDAKSPNWTRIGAWLREHYPEVEQRKRDKFSPGGPVVYQLRNPDDGSNMIRRWWAGWAHKTTAGVPGWAREILDADSRNDGSVTFEDFRHWNQAWLDWVTHSTYMRAPQRTEFDESGHEVGITRGFRNKEGARGMIPSLHLHYRTLRTFGHASTTARSTAMRYIEEDAQALGVEIDNREHEQFDNQF